MKIQNHPGAWGVLAGLLVFLIGVIATCASCAALPAPKLTSTESPRTPQEQIASTYGVVTSCLILDQGTMHGGSAVMIDAHHLLTARHVVKCENGAMPALRVESADGRHGYDAYVQSVWVSKDVALLYVRFELAGRPALLATALPHVGDATCAHVANPRFGASCGEVTDIRVDNPDGDVYVSTVYIRGNSGGGVYVDGVLYGIVTHFVPCVMNPEESCGGNFSSIAGLL